MGYFWLSEAAFYLLVLCRKHLCREDKCSVNIHKICPSKSRNDKVGCK